MVSCPLAAHRALPRLRHADVSGDKASSDITSLLQVTTQGFFAFSIAISWSPVHRRLGDAPLKVFWGYASWNATQLLGEIARRGWGLVDAQLSSCASDSPENK